MYLKYSNKLLKYLKYFFPPINIFEYVSVLVMLNRIFRSRSQLSVPPELSEYLSGFRRYIRIFTVNITEGLAALPVEPQG